jgi:glutathione synthase/RimK-type ligase-like ATP-grasp enzyme
MFQEKIDKQRELRVTLVGDRLFTAYIDSTGSEVGQIDWRLDDSLSYGWTAGEIPKPLAEQLRQLVHSFGLNYSAADFILTPDGRFVFLEINAAGEWVWLARDLGLPIAEAIADVLSKPARRLGVRKGRRKSP